MRCSMSSLTFPAESVHGGKLLDQQFPPAVMKFICCGRATLDYTLAIVTHPFNSWKQIAFNNQGDWTRSCFHWQYSVAIHHAKDGLHRAEVWWVQWYWFCSRATVSNSAWFGPNVMETETITNKKDILLSFSKAMYEHKHGRIGAHYGYN